MISKIIIQIIGAVAFGLLMLSYYQKKKIDILMVQIFSSICFAIHYYCLDGLTGAICNLITIVMFLIIYIFEKREKQNKRWILILLISLLLIITIFLTYENIYSILPIMATVLAMISFIAGNEKIVRIIGVITAIDWMIYGSVCYSYVSVIFNFITVVTTIIAIIKNKREKAKTV